MRLAIRNRTAGEATVRFDSDRGIFTAASAHPGYPLSYLATDPLAFPWKAYGQWPSQTALEWSSTIAGANRTLGCVALLATNRELPSAATPADYSYSANTVKITIDEFPLLTRRRPPVLDAGFTLTNLTGAASDIRRIVDYPEDVVAGYASTWLAAVAAASNTVVQCDFTNHHASERLLSGTSTIRVLTRDSDGFPSTVVAAVLRQSGADIPGALSPGTQEISEEGMIHTWTFDASSLTSTTGTIGVRLTGSTTGTSTVEFGAIELVTSLTGHLWSTGPSTVTDRQMLRWFPDLVIDDNMIVYALVEFSKLHGEGVVVLPLPGGGTTGALASTPLASGLQVGRFVGCDTIEISTSPDSMAIQGANDDEGQHERNGFYRASMVTHAWEEFTVKGEYWDTTEIIGQTGLKRLIDDTHPLVPIIVCPYDDHPEFDRFARITGYRITPRGSGRNGRTGVMGYLFDVEIEFSEVNSRTALRG